MRAYYSEYVRHCLRYYIKTLDEGHGGLPSFRSDADRENWRACFAVLSKYSDQDMDMIANIYRAGDTVPDKIFTMSKNYGLSQAVLWSLANATERKIAKRRGLI